VLVIIRLQNKKGEAVKKTNETIITQDFALYEKGKEYNRAIGHYDTVDKNERFYRGDQWNNVNSGGLPTPVFNIFKRIINYFIATITSQKISLHFDADGISYLFDENEKEKIDSACNLINSYLNYRYDKDKITDLLSKGLLDAAICGDMFAYVYWDGTKKNPQGYTGDFATALIDSTNVFFGNVNSAEVEDQPYILISGRELVENLRAEAAASGISREDIEKIVPDDDTCFQSGDLGKEELKGTKCTYVIKLYKKNGTVRFRKSCAGTVICPERDTQLHLYPVALMNWDSVKNSYHGQAVATGMIENQIYINKAFAMVMKHMMDVSFSKVVYNSNVIDEWTNGIGEAIAVNGPVENAALRLEPGSMQSTYLDVLSMTLSVTKELLGASDVALGNVNPTNTSAIIALQQAASLPLENQKRALYGFVEKLGLIWLDYILNYYDASRMILFRKKGELSGGNLDLKSIKNAIFSCKVDVGASAYWSELACVTTLDNLLTQNRITFKQYLNRLPDGYIPQKSELLEELEEQNEINIPEKQQNG